MAEVFGGWLVAASIASLTVMIWIGNVPKQGNSGGDTGLTTEFAILIMFFAGMLAAMDRAVVAVVVSGVVMVLLQGKKPLHELVARIGEGELRAIARLVLISLVILPVLPDRGYGYFEVFNPFRVWLMVVLIVGISLVAYLVAKYVGPHRGVLLSGILGGADGLPDGVRGDIGATGRIDAEDNALHRRVVHGGGEGRNHAPGGKTAFVAGQRIIAIAAAAQRSFIVAPVLRSTGLVRDSVGLSSAARERNIAGRVRLSAAPPGEVLLVDDIITTGATAHEAVRVLVAGGARVTAVLALAQV
jgi:hypothetical protein